MVAHVALFNTTKPPKKRKGIKSAKCGDGTVSHLVENLETKHPSSQWIQEYPHFPARKDKEICWEDPLLQLRSQYYTSKRNTRYRCETFPKSPQTHDGSSPAHHPTPSFDRLTQLGSIIKPLVFGDPRFSYIHFNKHSKSLGLCQRVCIIVYIMIEKGNKRISTGLLWPIFVECINNRRKSLKAQTTSH